MQAVARVDAADGTPYLLVTRNGNTGSTCPGRASEHANMHIVKMGSRDKDGERMRSNRLRRNSETTDTPPETTDRVVRTIYSTAPPVAALRPSRRHAADRRHRRPSTRGRTGRTTASTKILSTSATRRTRLRCPARSLCDRRRRRHHAVRAAARARGCRARPVTT